MTDRHDDTVVRDALRSFEEGAGARPRYPTGASPTPARERRLAIAAVLVATVALGTVAVVGAATPTGCKPVTFAFAEPPSAQVRSELALAVDEIEDRTGLTFVERTTGPVVLEISWSDGGVAPRVPSSALPPTAHSASDGTLFLGYGAGLWRVVGDGRSLTAATIAFDASVEYPSGLDVGDSLASLFVHELGHVLGLAHSSDPASFMRPTLSPEARQFVPHEQTLLAEIGRAAGCQPVNPPPG